MSYSHIHYSEALGATKTEAESKIRELTDHLTIVTATPFRKGELGPFGVLTPQESKELMKLLQQHSGDADFDAIRRKAEEDYDTKLVNSDLHEMVMGAGSTDNGETHQYLLRVETLPADKEHVDLYLALLTTGKDVDLTGEGISPVGNKDFHVVPINGRGEISMRNRITPVVYSEEGFNDVVGDGWFHADEKRHLRYVSDFLVE